MRPSAAHLVCYAFFGPVDDLGWTYVQNLARAWTDEVLGTMSRYAENVYFQSEEAQIAIFDGFISDGCDLIVTGSDTLYPKAVAYASTYPDVKFIAISPSSSGLPNLGTAYVKVHQASYIAGMIAAMQPGVERIGWVGSMYAWDSLRNINAFALGMRSVNASKQLYTMHVGSWFDPRSERIAALRLIREHGVGILAYDSDSTEVVAVAKEEGKYSIAMKSDGTALLGETNLMSQIFVWNNIFVHFVNASMDDALWAAEKDLDYFSGFERGAVSLGTFSSIVPAASRIAAKDAIEQFERGEDRIFCGTFESFCPADSGINPLETILWPCEDIPLRVPNASAGLECLTDSEVRDMSWLVRDAVVDLGLLQVPAACPAGTRIDALAPELCVPCETGTFSNIEDAVQCSACSPGFFSNRIGVDRCDICATGTFSEEAGQTVCTQCELGYTSLGAATECIPCEAGTHGAADRSCQKCVPGSFANESGFVECRLCPPGHYSEGGAAICTPCPEGFARLEEGGIGHSSCERCPRGTYADVPGLPECKICAGGLTTDQVASMDPEDCVCQEGSYKPLDPAKGSCVTCPVGMICPLGAQEQFLGTEPGTGLRPLVEEGFYAAKGALSVYKCTQDKRRCPGGELDSCAPGREGVQCGRCIDGYQPGSDGSCEPCGDTGPWPFLGCTVFTLFALIAAYQVGTSQGVAKKSHSIMLVALAGSQLISIVQTLAAVSLMSIEWPEPLASFLILLQLLNFNIEVLKIQCFVTHSPVALYIGQLAVVFCLLGAMVIIHFVVVAVRHGRRFRSRRPALINAVGLVVMAFFISMVTTILSPLHCSETHPNGLSTLRNFPTVLCWESEEHSIMIAFAAMASLLPISFVYAAVWAVRSYGARISAGDTDFLSSWSFLLFRFRSGRHWFALANLARSLLISLTPVIPYVVGQLLFLTVVLLCSLVCVVYSQPWRVWQANVLDTVIIGALLVVLNLASMFLQDVDAQMIGIFCLFVIILMCLAFPAIMVYAVVRKIQHKLGYKPFSHFICHHKATAGSFARLMKMVLSGETGKKIFIDSDNLTDLDSLFNIVGTQTEMLVALCTSGLLRSAWCVGEITTCKLNSVSVLKISFPCFEDPSDEFIDSFHDHVSDVSILAERGMHMDFVKDVLRWFHSCPMITLPPQLASDNLQALKAAVLSPPTEFMEDGLCLPRSPINLDRGTFKSVIIVDHSNFEAVATAFILAQMLRPYFAHEPDGIPSVLGAKDKVPRSIEVGVIVCSSGAFDQPAFLHALTFAAGRKVGFVPLLADADFRVPSLAFFEKRSSLFESVTGEAGQTMQLIKDIFKEIAVVFQPGLGSSTEQVLMTKARELAARLGKRDRLKHVSLKEQDEFDMVIQHLSVPMSRHSVDSNGRTNGVDGVGSGSYAGLFSAADEDEDFWLAPDEPAMLSQPPRVTPQQPSSMR